MLIYQGRVSGLFSLMTEPTVIYQPISLFPDSETESFFLVRIEKGRPARAIEQLLDLFQDKGIAIYWYAESDSSIEALNQFMGEV
jgi:hypothetical protein